MKRRFFAWLAKHDFVPLALAAIVLYGGSELLGWVGTFKLIYKIVSYEGR